MVPPTLLRILINSFVRAESCTRGTSRQGNAQQRKLPTALSSGDHRLPIVFVCVFLARSWATIFFPEVWMHLEAAILKGEYKHIPGVLVNEWPSSWQKFMFSLMFQHDWYLLYPGYEKVMLKRGAVVALVAFCVRLWCILYRTVG